MLESTAGGAVPSEDAILATLKRLFRSAIEEQYLEAADIDGITAETHLLGLPLDSLALAGLMLHVEDAFGIYVDDEVGFEFRTVGDLIAHIRSQVTAKAERAAARAAR